MKLSKLLFWKNGTLVHDEEKCIYCGLCGTCPHLALKVEPERRLWKLRGICMRCNKCVRECPAGALKIISKGSPPTSSE